MARTLTDEDIKLNIIINGNPAQKQLVDLEKATRQLTKENKNLTFEKGKLEKAGQKESAEYKNLTAKIKENQTAIDNNKASMKELTNQIGIMGLTMRQLGDKAKLLRMQLNNAIPGGEAYQAYQKELKDVNDRLSELKGKAQSSKLSISSLADGFNKYAALGASVIAGLTGVVLSVQKIIDLNGKLSDSQADVMKTTGMNKKEVDELTKSFGLLETRTSRVDLLNIAEQGGRIGIAKEEIGAFVDVMNKASVALGDSFTGGAEEVANKLGKLKFLFQETKDMSVDQAYNSIGSAINDLGANGVASEANIADFATRIGSLTDVLKPTIKETLALGAAFEESGIESEVSARAYNIFMKQASTESAKFAKVMNLSQKEVENMINTNPLDFMLKFSEGMKGMDATKTAKTLDYLGINADGANKVIGAMGNNFNRFKELIDLSNNSFAEGTSLINEYSIKNETLGATLEKIYKKVSGWFSSETFIKYLGGAITWFGKFIGATEDADGSVSAWKNTLLFTAKVIAIVTAAIVTNVGWQKLVAMWTTRNAEATMLYNIAAKARAFADGVAMVASQGYAAVTMLLTGNVKGAIQAFRVMTATMMTTPWGFIIGAVAAIGTAYMMFAKEVKQAETAQSMMADTATKTGALVEKESQTFMTLLAVVNDTTASTEARTEALKKAKEIGGEYTKGLTIENIATAEGKKMIDLYIQSLQRKMQLQVLEAKQKELLEKINDRKNQKIEEELDYWDQLSAMTRNFGNVSTSSADLVIVASKKRKDALSDLQSQLNFTNAEMKAFLEKNPNVIKTIGTDTPESKYNTNLGGGDKGNTGGGSNNNKTVKKYDDSYINDELKLQEQLYAIRKKAQEAEIALMEDGYSKDLALEKLATDDKIQQLKFDNEGIFNLNAKLKKDLIEAEKLGNVKHIASIKNQQNLLIEKQKGNNELICYEEELQKIRLGTIEEKAAKKLIEIEHNQYEQEKLARETAFNNELNAKNVSEEEKKRLKEEFNNKEIAFQKEYLLKKIDELNKILQGDVINGIDFNLLSPEAKKKILEDIELAKNAFSKLKEAGEGKSENDGKHLDLGLATKGDILGFSQDTWDKFFKNIQNGTVQFEDMQMAIMAASQVFSQIDAYMTASENRNVKQTEKNADKKKVALKRQLDAGYINQDQYNKRVEAIDKEVDKKKEQIEIRQAKRQKAIAVLNIITDTARSIMAIASTGGGTNYADFGVSAGILTGLVTALGALQLATVLKQPMPGHEQGLYPEYVTRQQDGKSYKASYQGKVRSGMVNKTSYFMVAENGPEMVIDNKAWRQISPETQNLLIRELQGIKGFEQGYYKDNVLYSGSTATGANQPANNDSLLVTVIAQNNMLIAENTAVLKEIRDKEFIATMNKRNLRDMKDLNDGIKDYNTLRNRNKI